MCAISGFRDGVFFGGSERGENIWGNIIDVKLGSVHLGQ